MNPLSDYAIRLRNGRSVTNGKYEITSKGTCRMGTEFREFYKTDLGEFSSDEWRKRTFEAIKEHGKQELLERIKEHCRDHCAWLRKEGDIEEYAMECLVSGAYMYWNDFFKSGYMYFYFPKED